MTNNNTLATIIGFIILFLLYILAAIGLITIGWHLFIIPVFGLKAITFMEALGLIILLMPIKGAMYNQGSK